MTPERLTELEHSSLHDYYGLSQGEEEECFAALHDLLARLRSAEAWVDKADEERRILANRLDTAESATRDAEAGVKRLKEIVKSAEDLGVRMIPVAGSEHEFDSLAAILDVLAGWAKP